ncbi:MAG: alpha/beta hydrolase family protein [Deltaproteobacteria bacterium]|nr:alpha/beta hydrolase family protein [Deltaproteobacteria bacterium]
MTSLLDRLYASQSNRLLFFKDGWGDLPRLRELHRRAAHPGPPRPVEVRWEETLENGTTLLRRGAFLSPYTDLPLPAESRTSFIELVLPPKASRETPICMHFAATGDEGFERRRRALALPLLREGIGSLILENPYYGRRRPPGQHKKMLNRFSDLWAMGGAAVEEGRSLMQWLRREGYERLGVCGISMGGSMAARVAVLEETPVAMIGCVTAHSASAVFTEGILKNYLAWEVLNRELDGDESGIALNRELGGSETAIELNRQVSDAGPAMMLMRELLDLTDLRRSPPLRRPEAAFLVAASRDAYIPPASAAMLHAHWPGSTMRWLGTGHVGAFLFHRRDFLKAIRDAFAHL